MCTSVSRVHKIRLDKIAKALTLLSIFQGNLYLRVPTGTYEKSLGATKLQIVASKGQPANLVCRLVRDLCCLFAAFVQTLHAGFLLAVVNDLLHGLYVTIKDETKATAGFIDSFNVDGPILR